MIAGLVPLKRLAEAKSRLAPRLDDGQRRELVLGMAAGVVCALRESGLVGAIALVSPEANVAARLGVHLVPDEGTLNGSLLAGLRWAETMEAEAALIIPADLPLVTHRDIESLIGERSTRGIVIARSRDGGTGALLMQPPGLISPAFGEDSFNRHCALARAIDAKIRQVARRAFSLDLDRAEDLDAVRRAGA